jgi:hypothetical protein
VSRLDNDILIIAVVDAIVSKETKENIANNIKKGLDEGVIIKDKTISNLYVIDRDKKEMITLVY